MQGCGVEIACRSNFDNATQVHHSDAVADVFHHRQIMGNEQIGEVELVLQVFEQVNDLRLDRHIQR